MAATPPHSQWLEDNIYMAPYKIGNYASDVWNELTPDQSYDEIFETRRADRKRIAEEKRAALSNRDANTAREYSNQGITRPNPKNYIEGAQGYGSYNTSNSTRSPPTPTPVQYQQGLGSQRQMLIGQDMESPAEIDTMQRNKAYRNKEGIINQGVNNLNANVVGSTAIVKAKDAAEDERKYIEASGAYKQFHSSPDNLGMKPIRVGSSIGYRDPDYIGASPTSFGSPFGEYQTARPQQLGQSAQWHQSMQNKVLPRRATPEPQTKVLGTNVADPLGRQGDSDFNQTSGTQALNNGNVNNPKSTNKPNANRSGNGFWN